MTPTVTVAQARCAVAAAEHRSFRRAAITVGLSQPAFSMHIANLERIVGASIFERTSRGVQVTADGRLILSLIARFVSSHDRLIELSQRGRGASPPLTIVSHRPGMVIMLPAVMGMLNSVLADVDLELTSIVHLEDVNRLVANGSADIGLGYRAVGEALADTGIEEVPIGESPIAVFMPSSHRLARYKYVTLDDVRNETIIQLSTASSRDLTRSLNAESPAAPSRTVTDSQAALALVAAGAGLSILPEIVSRFVVPNVVCRRVRPAMAGQFTVMRRRHHAPSPAADVVWRLLADDNSLFM